MNKQSKLIHGIGSRSKKYPAYFQGNPTKEYSLWVAMLSRCTEKCQKMWPTYIGVTCSENFKSFEYFYEWCQQQIGFKNKDDKGNYWELDKDTIIHGNKIYSEDVCAFVPKDINYIFLKRGARRGEHPIGVYWNKGRHKFQVICSNGRGYRKYLGLFSDKQEAFQTYKIFKEAYIKQVAEEYKHQLDYRVYAALINYEVNIND